jgi:hypothetical protein
MVLIATDIILPGKGARAAEQRHRTNASPCAGLLRAGHRGHQHLPGQRGQGRLDRNGDQDVKEAEVRDRGRSRCCNINATVEIHEFAGCTVFMDRSI